MQSMSGDQGVNKMLNPTTRAFPSQVVVSNIPACNPWRLTMAYPYLRAFGLAYLE
jgi:hypothetical protein